MCGQAEEDKAKRTLALPENPVIPDLPTLRQAAADFRYLLARGYPRRASLTLVGNRYGLARLARQLLHRGVFAPLIAAARQAKRKPLAEAAGGILAVDGHNVLITLEAALTGLPLVAADDGFIRDVAEISRAYRPRPTTHAALALLVDALREAGIRSVTVLFDAPMRKSGQLAQATREAFKAAGLWGEARAVPVPETELLAFPGPIATSDTHLIDAHEAVVDLAGEIIRGRELLPGALILL